MRKFKTKLASILVALTCVFACLGVGVFAMNNSLEAKAASNTYTITKLTALTNGAAADSFYAYAEEGEKPSVNSWDYVFTFVAESGEGVKWNGEAYDGLKVKQPGSDLFFELGRTAEVGDVFTIGGTFYNETADAEIIIPTTSFEWNGTTWGPAYPKHNLGKLILHVNSQPWGGAGSQHDAIYLAKANGEALPILDWDHNFTAESAENFKINGANATFTSLKSTEAGLYIAFGRELAVGEYITVSGTFTSEYHGAKLVIEKSSFEWTNDGWKQRVEYTSYTITSLAGTADGAYIYSPNNEIPKDKGDWDNRYTLVDGEITLNGTAITLSEVKMPGDLYVVFGFEPQVDDVVVFNGTLANETTAIKLVFNNCQMKWNGTTWETVGTVTPDPEPDPDPTPDPEPDPEPTPDPEPEAPTPVPDSYERYNLGPVTSVSGDAEGVYLAFTGVTLPIDSWNYAFDMVNGEGITVDGNMVSLVNNIKSVGNKLYVTLSGVEVGSILRINGTLGNADTEIAYVIEESEYEWNGSTWATTAVVEYTTHEIGALALHNNSTIGGAKDLSDVIYLKRADEGTFPVLDWEKPFVAENADNFKVNGVAHSLVKVVSTGDGFYWSFGEELKAGDYITISGTFACESEHVKYVIEESSFVWTGTAWEKYVAYTTYETDGLIFTQTGNGNTHVYFVNADAHDFPIATTENDLNWTTAFSWKDGVGVTLNGNAISATVKFPGQMFIDLGAAPSVGDVLAVGGTFYSPTLAYAYTIGESTFIWNGTTWVAEEDVIEYTTYQITALASTADPLYWYTPNGELPKDVGDYTADWDNVYTLVNGTITLNGNAIDLSEIKLPGDLYVVTGFEPQVNDVLVLNGAIANDTTKIKLVFNNCQMKWNGTTWETVETVTPDPEPDPDPDPDPDAPAEEFELGKGVSANGDTVGIYIAFELSVLPVSHWTAPFELVSGHGITVDGVMIDLDNTVKSVSNTLYVGLSITPIEGSILKIGGTFICEELNVIYVIEDSEFTWNGATWTTDYIPEVEYTSYELGKFILAQASLNADVRSNALYLKRFDGGELPILDWETYTFAATTGYIKVNGELKQLSEMKSTPEGLYIAFEALDVNDQITIGGAFVCSALNVEYIIEESTFEWVGIWRQETHIDYEIYDVGALVVWNPTSSATAIYLNRADGQLFQVSSWDFVFAFVVGSGSGLTIGDGEFSGPLATGDIKSPGGSLYIGLGVTIEIGEEITIEGLYGNFETGIAYRISESTFVYTTSGWINKIDLIKSECCDELDSYLAAFDSALYHESEWNYMQSVVKEAKTAIQNSYAQAEIREIVAQTKATLDSVMTSDVADAEIENVRASSKNELDAYKSQEDYRTAEWATIMDIIAEAKVAINEATSVSGIIVAREDAKEQIDAVKTAAMLEAEEAVVEAAKAELAAYKNEADYRAKEWAQIQAILVDAGEELDLLIGYPEDIAELVISTKAKLDAVKVKEVAEADDAVANAAKAELAAYKSQTLYYDAQWAEIQAIITEAGVAIDAVIGDEEAIASIVEAAKAEMDKVLVMDAYDEFVFNKAIEDSKNEIMNYYNALNYDLYTEEALTTINGYVASAVSAIESAATVEEMQTIVLEFKSNVDSVEKISTKPSTPNNPAVNKPAKSGCGLSIGGAVTCLIPALAMAVIMISRKKRED